MGKYAFVGCSSSHLGNEERICRGAETLINLLIKYDFNLTFGASKEGLMGKIYKALKQENRKIRGISLDFYKESVEFATNKENCDEYFISNNIEERINTIFDNSDVLVFLAGSVGTLQEFFTTIEMMRRAELDSVKYKRCVNSKIIVYDEEEVYYNGLVSFLKASENLGFSTNNKYYEYITNADVLCERLSEISSLITWKEEL